MDKVAVVNQISEHIRAGLDAYATAMQGDASDLTKTALDIALIGVPESLTDLLANLQDVAAMLAEQVVVFEEALS